MKLDDFRITLKQEMEVICQANGWKMDNEKLRGMAFEDWCFDFFADRYQIHDNKKADAILRNNDGGIDIIFESRDTQEVYIIQCKCPKLSSSDPISEESIKAFFANFALFKDQTYVVQRDGKNRRLYDLSIELNDWIERHFTIYFLYVSTGKVDDKSIAISNLYNKEFKKSNINIIFGVWGISELKDQYLQNKKIEETYPALVSLTLADGHFMEPKGELRNLTFAIRATELKRVALQHKDSLFNWNIRRYLSKKGEVNQSITRTIDEKPGLFYYFNNGISALCERFKFDSTSKNLNIEKLQIVNGAQTIGTIQRSTENRLTNVFVLVKLTEIPNSTKEKGVAAELIRTNNTQNKLNAPDFRSNDKIQLWIEQKFKDTKPKGELLQIDYGRKRPYPRSSAYKQVIKLQDLAKIRYAWLHDPRVAFADPAILTVMPEDGGLYAHAFGINGELVDLWTEDQFKDTLLAIHTFNFLSRELSEIESKNIEYKQISRLKYYALKLFKLYVDDIDPLDSENILTDLYLFGGKYSQFFTRAFKIISITLKQTYDEILNREEGTAFSLPRDSKVWELAKRRFADNLTLAKSLS